MTSLPTSTDRKLGLVIDLDTCVGCHACAVNCKEWNTGGYGAPLADIDPYGSHPEGAWLNRIHTFEVTPEDAPASIVHFPKSCLHCDDAPCVTVCPTGASYKRREDGIVLVDEDMCIGCGLCVEACPTRALTMTNEYEMADDNRAGLIYEKDQLLAPLKPDMAAPPHALRPGTTQDDYYRGDIAAAPERAAPEQETNPETEK